MANKQRTRPCVFSMLPTELRTPIWNLVFPEEWTGKMPDIIRALRTGPPHIYREALEDFNKMNYAYVLDERNRWGQHVKAYMSKATKSTIRSVTIKVTQEMMMEYEGCMSRLALLTSSRELKFVEAVHVMARGPIGVTSWYHMFHFVWLACTTGFTSLRTISMSRPPEPPRSYQWNYIYEWAFVRETAGLINRIDRMFGVTGYAVNKTRCYLDLNGMPWHHHGQDWYWKAREGEVINHMTRSDFLALLEHARFRNTLIYDGCLASDGYDDSDSWIY